MIALVIPQRCFSAASFQKDVDRIGLSLVNLRILIQAYVSLITVHPQTSSINFAFCPGPAEFDAADFGCTASRHVYLLG